MDVRMRINRWTPGRRALLYGDALASGLVQPHFVVDGEGIDEPIASLPVYVAHASRLRHRRRFVRTQLRALGAPDVTMVLCADAEEVARLTVAQRRCLHPVYARTRWSPTSGTLLVENGPDGSG